MVMAGLETGRGAMTVVISEWGRTDRNLLAPQSNKAPWTQARVDKRGGPGGPTEGLGNEGVSGKLLEEREHRFCWG